MPGLSALWKPVGIVLVLLAARHVWTSYGTERFNAGYAQAQAEQQQAEERLKAQYEREKAQLEDEALSRVNAAQADAESAHSSADRLRAELDRIRQLAQHYTGTFPPRTPASKVIGVLADMLEESNRIYRATAEEAERYRNAGESCENQYESLRKPSTLTQ